MSEDRDAANEAGTLADQVLARLQDDIVRGVFAPGSKVRECELADRYGVSRGPLREAMRSLEERRLLTRSPHVGARVAALGLRDLKNHYEVREVLEGAAAGLAACEMSMADIRGLDDLLSQHEQQEDLRENTAYFQREGDLDFHYCVAAGSGNGILADLLMGDLYHLARLYRYQFSAVDHRPGKALTEHRRVAEAIEARDGELAEILMRRHIRGAWANIEAQVDGTGDESVLVPLDVRAKASGSATPEIGRGGETSWMTR